VKHILIVFCLLCLSFMSACGSRSFSGYSISGTVVSNGVPKAGATITLAGASNAEVTTNEAGEYEFSGIKNGNYTLTPSMDGMTFFPVSLAVTVKNSDVTNQNLEAVTGSAGTHSISGAVVTAGGGGIEGVKLTVTGATTGSVFTDTDGHYSLTGLTDGSYAVTPAKTGFTFTPGSISTTVDGADITGQNFSTSTYLISGTVTSAGGGAMQGVTVSLSGLNTASTTTDANGYYSFQVTENGNYAVAASKAGYSFTPSSLSVTLDSADVPGRDFTADTYSISGTIMAGGAALSGVTVTLSGTASATATTDSDGYYSFPVTLKGVYVVTPSKTGYSFSVTSTSATIGTSDVTGLDFTAVTYSISGTVTSGGSALAGVTVSLSGASTGSATTAADGSYRFTGLLNGNYTVTPALNGYSFIPSSISATVSNADVAGGNFTGTVVSTTYSISGTITSGGTPLAGAIVVLSGAAANAAMTDTGGNYSFTGLSNGNYTVTATLAGWDLTPASHSVTVGSGNSTGNNFTAVYRISGTITAGGTAVPGATGTLSGAAAASTTTDAAGNYSLTGLTNGTYTVTPSLAGYTFTPANRSMTVSDADASGNDFTAAYPSGSLTFNPTGAVQTWTVPYGITSVTLTCSGGQGTNQGGTATGTLAVTAGQTFSMYVGSAGVMASNGQNGGIGRGGSGMPPGESGGAASYVLVGGTLVIGAGGGGGIGLGVPFYGGGGGGVGGGGSDSSTHAGGDGGNGVGYTGGFGGTMTYNASDASAGSGAGGGGGGMDNGGAGAGYVNGLLTGRSSTVGGNAGNGRVTISW
jgi:inhibitor of cysteine peptidase